MRWGPHVSATGLPSQYVDWVNPVNGPLRDHEEVTRGVALTGHVSRGPEKAPVTSPAVAHRRRRPGFAYRGTTRARAGAFEWGEPAASRGETGRS